MNEQPLPPILKVPGLQLVAMGTTEKGHPFFKFATVGGHGSNFMRLQEVVLYVTSDKPVKLKYAYSIYDETTRSLTSYHGTNGDPERDTLGDITGV